MKISILALTALLTLSKQQSIDKIIEKTEAMIQETNYILEPSILVETKVEKKDEKKIEKKDMKPKTCDEDESACTYKYCEAHPEFKWCTRVYCYNFLNKEKPQCIAPSCFKIESACSYEWCHLNNYNLGSLYCQESYCTQPINQRKKQCKTPISCDIKEENCTWDWCHQKGHSKTQYCTQEYCDTNPTHTQCFKPITCAKDQTLCTYTWCQLNDVNKKSQFCNEDFCAEKQNQGAIQCHSINYYAHQGLNGLKKQFDAQEDVVAAAKKALLACEKKNKINPIAKSSGKKTKAQIKADSDTSKQIKAKCPTEVKNLTDTTAILTKIKTRYTKFAGLYKDDYGGIDAPWLLSLTAGVVVLFSGCAWMLRKKIDADKKRKQDEERKKQLEEPLLDEDDEDLEATKKTHKSSKTHKSGKSGKSGKSKKTDKSKKSGKSKGSGKSKSKSKDKKKKVKTGIN